LRTNDFLDCSSSLRVGAAVDGEARAGDVISLWARYEGDQRSNVFDMAVALERCGRKLGLGPLVVGWIAREAPVTSATLLFRSDTSPASFVLLLRLQVHDDSQCRVDAAHLVKVEVPDAFA
jgi:hypothetical protein